MRALAASQKCGRLSDRQRGINFLSVLWVSSSCSRRPRRARDEERPARGEDEAPRDAHDDDDVVERHPRHVHQVHRQDLVPELFRYTSLVTSETTQTFLTN